MKEIIKYIIPNKMLPTARKIYWWILIKFNKVSFTKEQYEKLPALKCFFSYNKYGGYCVPESSRHRPAALKILSNDVYEPKTIEFILSHCGDGDIVHAGTYFGDFLPALSSGISRNAKVWAFEPNPENYKCARITMEINDIKNVMLFNAGLGALNENLLVRTHDEKGCPLGGGSQIIIGDSTDSAGAESVQIVTIDEMVSDDRTVSIIQLDVEGYEKEALTGGLKTIKRCLPIILLEILPESTLLDSEWFAENIVKLGYRKIDELHGNSVFAVMNN